VSSPVALFSRQSESINNNMTITFCIPEAGICMQTGLVDWQ
jgi:hypothetical protein